MMMDESVRHRDYRSSSLDRRGDERRRAARLPGTAWASSVLTFDRVAQHGLPLWTSPDMPLAGRERHRAETRPYRAADGNPADRRRHPAVA